MRLSDARGVARVNFENAFDAGAFDHLLCGTELTTTSCAVLPVTRIPLIYSPHNHSQRYSPSASMTFSAVSMPEKFFCPVIRFPSRTANPRHNPAWT